MYLMYLLEERSVCLWNREISLLRVYPFRFHDSNSNRKEIHPHKNIHRDKTKAAHKSTYETAPSQSRTCGSSHPVPPALSPLGM